MKKILVLTILLVTLVTGCFALVACNNETSGDFVVGVIQLAPHVALQQANDAFCTKLEELLAADGKKVSFINENAQGEDSNSVSIINTFIGKRVDLIYSIATASSQTAVNMAAEYEIPVIFNAVTDPVDAGLVKSLTAPTGGNVTGVSDINPIAQQVELMQELMGGGTDFKVGVLYVSKETNSVVQKDAVKAACDAKGIAFTSFGISEVADIGNGLNALKKDGADIVYLPTDNVLAESAAAVHAQNKLGSNLPIVCGEGGMTEACGVATLSVSYTKLGELAAQMAYDILTGNKKASEISVASQTEDFDYVVNEKVAEEIGFTIPQSVLDKA